MSYDVYRLLVLDWDATVAALRTSGDDFYWLARDSTDDGIDLTRIPFVAEPTKALGHLPGWRDPEANEIYDRLRDHLTDGDRKACDACFCRLFWERDDGFEPTRTARPRSMIADLVLPRDTPATSVWMALAPTTVRDVLGMLQRLPWPELEEAAARIGDFDTRYLHAFRDFEGHVADLEGLLVEAAERRAGVLSLVSY